MNTIGVNDLPDEMVAKIFEYLPKNQDSITRLRNVCTKWRVIVDKHLGVFLVAGTGGTIEVKEVQANSRDLLLHYTNEIVSTFDISEAGSNANNNNEDDSFNNGVEAEEVQQEPSSPSVLKGSLHDHGDASAHVPVISLEGLQEKLSCSPDYVRKLCFIGTIPIQVPGAFILMCKNLSGIHFHLSSLISIQSTVALIMDIPNLRTFVINSYGLGRTWNIGVPESLAKISKVLDVTVGLLEQNTFPHLETLIVDIPLCFEKENDIVSAISTFLARHSESVQSFCYHQDFIVVGSEGQETDHEHHVSLSNLAFSSNQLKKVFLKEIHIGLYEPQGSQPLWINFIIQQAQLEKLIFTGDRIPFPGTTIQANQATLTTLIIEVRDNVDCATLQDCCNLKKLSLLGKKEHNEDDDHDIEDLEEEVDDNDFQNKYINILNLKLLPINLENLRINGLKIESKSIGNIICSGRWGRLKRLEVIDCGIEGNLGVPLQAITHILEKKNFRCFQIDYSLNRKSVDETSVPQRLEMLAYILRNNSISNFRIQGYLNATGVYELCESMHIQFGGPDADLFQFPEEIQLTGFHRGLVTDIGKLWEDLQSSGNSSSDADVIDVSVEKQDT